MWFRSLQSSLEVLSLQTSNYFQIQECWHICCWGITRCPRYEAIHFCPIKPFLSSPSLRKHDINYHPILFTWQSILFVVSSDTLKIYTEFFSFFLPLWDPKLVFKPCRSELPMKWSAPRKKKGSCNAQWIRKCVCCQVCEVGVLRCPRCVEKQCGKHHSNTRIKNSAKDRKTIWENLRHKLILNRPWTKHWTT